jgi:dTDP-4-amino-4,6-dideoxygalactose transaminase
MPIYVTKPYLPPLEEFIPYLEKIWTSSTITNNGPFHNELEKELCKHLGVEHISLFTNGTIALITALQALKIKGEVITTPYSFIATAHSLLWNNLTPIFVDIDEETCNLNESLIESAITSQTSAILPVHCYGNPCNVEEIARIAKKHNLKTIYDSAHAFGVNYREQSLLNFGDLSVVSFHATKIFNTFEGGAIVSRSKEMKTHIDHLKNFGFSNETTISAVGINGKMSEINAAMGLLQLKHMDHILERRLEIKRIYELNLSGITGISTIKPNHESRGNGSYFPIFIDDKYPLTRDQLYEKLKISGIFSRRYFYPLISNVKPYLDHVDKKTLPIANKKSDSVLCLPIYPTLKDEEISLIVKLIRNN